MYNNNNLHALHPLELEMIRAEVQHTASAGQPANKATGLFTIKSGNDWMQQEHNAGVPNRLFGSFWYERELCILFADANMGKSILAVQIADSLASGCPIMPFALDVNRPLRVLYFDFELSARQFEMRYHNHQTYTRHNFGNHFYRAEFNAVACAGLDASTYEQMLYSGITNAIVKHQAEVLIIDNLTYLRHGTENARGALSLMKRLLQLKRQYNLSILALAHTPKRNMANPITGNDLQGSKMLINFADSAFAIGQSHIALQTRYIKQIKQRNTNEAYGANNVCVCHITQKGALLQFEVDGFAHEEDHLSSKADLEKKIGYLRMQGYTQRQMAAALNTSAATVNRMLRKIG